MASELSQTMSVSVCFCVCVRVRARMRVCVCACATCSKLSHLDGCYIASEPEQLYSHLSDLRSLHGGAISPYANQDLLETIENFIVRNA